MYDEPEVSMKHWNLCMAVASVMLLGCLLTVPLQAAPGETMTGLPMTLFAIPQRGQLWIICPVITG